MRTINISLSDALQHFALNKTQERGFHDESEYFENLVKQDKEKEEAHEKFRQLLLKGFNSGEVTPFNEKDWEADKARLIQEFKNSKR